MKVTDAGSLRIMLAAMNTFQAQQQGQYEQLASGKKVNRPSDEPVASHEIQILRQDLDRFNRFSKAIESVEPQLSQYDKVLSQVRQLLDQSYQLGSQAATSTTGSDERAIIGTQLRTIRDQLLGLANSTQGDDYIFSGTATTTQPFSMDPMTGVVSYNGNFTEISVEISPNVFVTKNMQGDRVFMGAGGVFDSMNALITAVESGTAMETALDGLSDATKDLKPVFVENGQKLAELTQSKLYLQARSTELVKSISGLEDANLAEIATDLSLTDTALKALYSTAANIGKNSFFSYIA